MSEIQTTLPSSADSLAAQEILRKRFKTKEIQDYRSRTDRRNRMLSEATKLESKSLARQQNQDRQQTENLLVRKINAAWRGALSGLKIAERQLKVVRKKAGQYDSATLFQHIEIAKTRTARMDVYSLEDEFNAVKATGSRTQVKAFLEVAASRCFELQHAPGDNQEDRKAANNLRARLEVKLSDLERNDTVDRFEAELRKAQTNVGRVLDQVEEAERLFGYDVFLGAGPFKKILAEIEIVNGELTAVPEANLSGFPEGYVPIKESE